jgi:hypothetical protein
MPALERSAAIIKKRMKTVLERLATNTLQSLFPASHPPSIPFNIITPHQQELAQPTAFQQISNPFFGHEQPQPPATYALQSVPMPWQSSVRSSLFKDPSFSDEFLPAFPGQTFPVGPEHSFGSEGMVDSQARTALLGFNLDPHARLNHSDLDWTFAESYSG